MLRNLEASSGPRAEGVPKTIRGDQEQGHVSYEEVTPHHLISHSAMQRFRKGLDLYKANDVEG